MFSATERFWLQEKYDSLAQTPTYEEKLQISLMKVVMTVTITFISD